MPDARQPPVRVVGAGISGLAAAWFLTERGRTVVIDEAAAEPGGLLVTERRPEGLVETAARGFLWSPDVATLFAAAGVAPLFADDRSKRRFIFRNGQPRRWPLGPIETLSLAAHGATAMVTRRTKARDDESVDAWGRRVIGRAGTEWILGPALQGIYASPIDALSARAIFGGGRVRGRLATAPMGMQQLLAGLVAALRARGVIVRFNSTVEQLEAGAPTIIATSAPAAVSLVRPHAPALADAIGAIRLTNLMSVTAFFEPNERDTRGFGVLFPRSAGVTALGVLFNSDMFGGRGPRRSETWIYGDASADVIEALRGQVEVQLVKDRQVLTGRTTQPVACYPTRWAQRLPVYGPQVLEAQGRLADAPPWLRICGNYAGKIGVTALVARARDVASEY